jgi:hypothetical protein
MALNPVTFETLIADQEQRLDRCFAPAGTNFVMDFINEINNVQID